VYVLDGFTFDSSPVVILPVLAGADKRTAEGRPDLADFTAGDAEQFQKDAPGTLRDEISSRVVDRA
jgi:hypothetical protein